MFLPRALIFFFAIQISWRCILSVDNGKVLLTSETLTKSSSKNVTTIKKQILCELCVCKGPILNCTNTQVDKNFTEYVWPNYTLKEALFINSSIENITLFPTVNILKLVISGHKIKFIDQGVFKQINSLQVLDLSNNHLTRNILQPDEFTGFFAPEDLEPLPDLKELDLSNNEITSLDEDFFIHMTSIGKLNLRNNPLQTLMGETGKGIAGLRRLENLNLNNCSLKELNDQLKYVIRDFIYLDLSNNLFKYPPNSLGFASKLNTLIMDSNPFTIIDKNNSFPVMKSLQILSMQNMPELLKVEAGSLSELSGLKSLTITNCPKFFYISGDAMANHNNGRIYVPLLQKLKLSNNSLQYLPMELVQWDKLEELSLLNNPWSCDYDNEELIKSFLPKFGSTLLKDEFNLLVCENPIELKGRKLGSLVNTVLRCLNVYEANSENGGEAAFLVGMLIGVLSSIPIILAIIIFWRKGYFVCGSKPASYSRAFYKRTADNYDY